MNKSSRVDIPLEQQRRAWNVWNAAAREHRISMTSVRQMEIIESWVASLGRTDLAILDVGCGTGRMCERLSRYGSVTGVDLADEVLERARARLPHVRFLAGDFFETGLRRRGFDVIVSLEVLAHVADQRAFVARLASLLKPGGFLMLATQNRPVLERWSQVGAAYEGQIRRWVNARELRELLATQFQGITIISTVPVGDQGWLRLVNSPKLNGLLGLVIPRPSIERLKECAMLGHTLLARAQPKPASLN